MRLIDADALTELIATNVYPLCDAFNSRDYGMFWTGGIEKAINEMPTIDAVSEVHGEWIPCSERLPKPYTEVLVCDECGWISLGVYRPCDVTEKDSGWSTLTRIKLPTDEVLAWMPLPDPWKGADDE